MMHFVFADVWELAYKACHPALNEQLSKLEHAAIARITNAFAPAHIRVVQPEIITLKPAQQRLNCGWGRRQNSRVFWT